MNTFAGYMEQILYGPLGYYSSGVARSGKAGDYFTAPDVSQVFGRLLSEIFRIWQDKLNVESFNVIEVGAGEGRLARDILSVHPFSYSVVERSAHRRELLNAIPDINVYPDLDSMNPQNGVLFGNELIDAFPVHRVRMKDAKFEEAYVDDKKLHWSLPSTPRLQSYFNRLEIILPEGYETEVNLAMADWLRQAGRVLQKGLLLLIDYGRSAEDYYALERARGTLRSFSKHKVSSDFMESEGVDLTADVDFTSLALDAREAGFTPLVFMEMGTFLMMGVEKLTGADFRARPQSESTGLKYLLHPEGMGATFHVLILGKNIDPGEWTFEHNRLRWLGLPA
jgi:SAM-dependent MidA family methyltransferase